MKDILLIFIVIVVLFFIHKFVSKFKIPKIGSLTLISGGVKTGKSTFSVALVRKEIKKRVRLVRFKNFFLKLFHKPLLEFPLVYSNVPLGFDYVPLTDDLLQRKTRFVYGSVVYIQEASLVADSQLIRDMDLNERLLLFNKLIGHETKGGCLIYDTQTISDCHYSIKRCLSNYFYIHHLVKFIPFILIAYVQEYRYSDDNSIIAINSVDTEDTLKKVIIPKSTWKYFDCYCYSILTDNLPVDKSVVKSFKRSDLKANKILSFRKNYKFNSEVLQNEKKSH